MSRCHVTTMMLANRHVAIRLLMFSIMAAAWYRQPLTGVTTAVDETNVATDDVTDTV